MMNNEFMFSKKQAEYAREAHHRWNFAIGAVRSGKSRMALQYTIPQCITRLRGKSGLNVILGATRGNIERNVIEPMADIWGDDLVSQISSNNIATIFGEKVYCIGAETKRSANRLRGSEIKFCYCDEITDINQETFEMLKSRLSLSYSVCHAAANPSYPTHFVKEFLDTAQKGVDIYNQKYTIYDNPFLPKKIVSSFEAEYSGTIYYNRYILGEWTLADGLIYPMYQKATTDILPDESKRPPEAVCMSMDYGTMNAFACLLWKKFSGVWYATKGYYYSGRDTGIQKTDGEYLQDLQERFREEISKCLSNISASLASGTPARKIEVIIDPSAASFIALLKKTGWAKVRPADNDVLNGIRDTASAMNTGKIKIWNGIKEWKEEAGGYAWDSKKTEKGEEKPLNIADHYMDATRYFVKTKKLMKRG